MPQNEIRIHREGTLRWVQASGTAGWATASAPASGLIGFVQAGFDFFMPLAKKYETILNRGIPSHHKLVELEPGKASFTVLWGVTGDWPAIITSSGVSTPQVHLEFRMQQDELAAASGLYYQLTNCVELSRKITEEANGNKIVFSYQYLTGIGPTGSGYIV